MTKKDIMQIQRKIGVVADGFWGPKSIAATHMYLWSMMPNVNSWPQSDQRALTKFYGAAGDEGQMLTMDVSEFLMEYEGARVSRMTCHRLVAASLKRIFTALRASPYAYVLQHFDGCYNNRKMRGGNSPSLHARGAAIDFMAASNGNLTPWPTVATMPLEVMEIFAKEGWLAAGAFWGRDAMHFQATL